MPHISQAGLSLIETFEGLRLRAYPDPGTGSEPWTIGYGHTIGVHPGQVITKAQALEFLNEDIQQAINEVSRVTQINLTQNQFDALVSFEYNTGALEGSTLLRCVNADDLQGAAKQFGRWIHAGGQVMPGLVTRRAAERALFLKI